jgi:hypothetical protein
VSSEWTSELAAAREDYSTAEMSGAVFPAGTRLAAARRLAARIDRFAAGGRNVLPVLEAGLRRYDDHIMAYTAARILAALPLTEAADILIAVCDVPQPFLGVGTLAKLGKRQALPAGLGDRVLGMSLAVQEDLARAVLRSPTDDARRLAEKLLGQDEPIAVDALAAWGETEALRRCINRPPLAVHAAFHLALAGDVEAVSTLVALTRVKRSAADAMGRLGYLAHPAGVEPAARLMRGRPREAKEFAIYAAGCLATPVLADPLLDLAEPWGRDSADAIHILSDLLGVDFDPVGVTETSRRRALMAIRTKLPDMDPTRRIRAGRPFRMTDLIDDLLGSRETGAWQLRAITGEDHGFDLHDDLVGNLAAIDAWRARAADPAPIHDGLWAFLGAPIDPPPPSAGVLKS